MCSFPLGISQQHCRQSPCLSGTPGSATAGGPGGSLVGPRGRGREPPVLQGSCLALHAISARLGAQNTGRGSTADPWPPWAATTPSPCRGQRSPRWHKDSEPRAAPALEGQAVRPTPLTPGRCQQRTSSPRLLGAHGTQTQTRVAIRPAPRDWPPRQDAAPSPPAGQTAERSLPYPISLPTRQVLFFYF